jgi:predicted permease
MVGIPPSALQEALFSPSGSLSLIGDSLEMLGQPLVPVLLLVLGANLSYGPGPGHLPPSTVLAMLLSRLVVLPLLGATLITQALSAGWIHMEDPLAVVVMMLVWSTPTAILVHSLASVHENGEDEISALLFWEYLSCVLTLPVCTAGYLYMLDCCGPDSAAVAAAVGSM